MNNTKTKNEHKWPILKLNMDKTKSNINDELKSQPAIDNNPIIQKPPISKPKEKIKKQLLDPAEYNKILSYFQKHYSKTFPAKSPPLPLAIGIHEQILSLPSVPFSKTKLRNFLKVYSSKKNYHKILVLDNNRVNIDGSIASQVTSEEIDYLTKKEFHNKKKFTQNDKQQKPIAKINSSKEKTDSA